MKKDLLTKPFRPDQVRQRPGPHGRTLSYVDIAAVVERLNEACDAWGFEIEKYEVQDGEVVVLGRLTIEGIARMAFGGSSVTTDREGCPLSIGDDLKAASSMALRKAASLFGVGLEFYGGTADEEVEAQAPRRSPSQPMERVTTRQLAALQAACRRRGMARGELMSLVANRTGKNELAHLSRSEASGLITELSSNGNGSGH